MISRRISWIVLLFRICVSPLSPLAGPPLKISGKFWIRPCRTEFNSALSWDPFSGRCSTFCILSAPLLTIGILTTFTLGANVKCRCAKSLIPERARGRRAGKWTTLIRNGLPVWQSGACWYSYPCSLLHQHMDVWLTNSTFVKDLTQNGLVSTSIFSS